ncbi:hypothetical protein M0R04_12970 [Candidatus Dojkabacteria bacterium]|jgi:hypothetical protein|nr:hypothetical protein [Candidatus Dojkabacteria bacterium]
MFDPTKYGAVKVTTPTTIKRFVPQQQTSTQPKEGFAEKLAGFAGVKNISKSIAYAISPEVRQYTKESIGAKPTAGQIAGDILQVGATVAMPGIGGGLAKTALKVGGLGAAAGLGAGLSEGESISDSIKQAFTTGLTSAATVGILGGAGKIISKISRKAPEALMTDALGVSKKMIEKGQNPAKLLVAEKQYGGKNIFNKLGSLYSDTQNAMLNLNEAITSEGSKIKKPFEAKNIIGTALKNITESKGKLYARKEIINALNKSKIDALKTGGLFFDENGKFINKSISFNEFNKLRQELGDVIGDTGFKLQKPSLQKSILTEVWKSVRNNISESSPIIGEHITQLGKYKKAFDVIDSAMAKAQKQGIVTWGDLVLGGVGAGAGGLPGAVGLYGLKKLASSPNAKITAAQAINAMNETISKLPKDKLGNIDKILLINALKGL